MANLGIPNRTKKWWPRTSRALVIIPSICTIAANKVFFPTAPQTPKNLMPNLLGQVPFSPWTCVLWAATATELSFWNKMMLNFTFRRVVCRRIEGSMLSIYQLGLGNEIDVVHWWIAAIKSSCAWSTHPRKFGMEAEHDDFRFPNGISFSKVPFSGSTKTHQLLPSYARPLD